MKPVLTWDKPKPIMSKADWSANQADSAPPGTYMPNMSEADRMRWKAKLVGTTKGFPQVELRRDSTVIVLSLKGYKYKYYDTRRSFENIEKAKKYSRNVDPSEWATIHIASAGPMQLTMDEFKEMETAITEGLGMLRDLEEGIVR